MTMQQTVEPGPTTIRKKKKKKKKSNVPRHKRLNRTARLAVAKDWIKKYEGKRIVLSYAKYFAVDHLCAVAELKKLGVAIDPEYERQLRATAAGKAKTRAERHARREEEEAALRDALAAHLEPAYVHAVAPPPRLPRPYFAVERLASKKPITRSR